MAVNLLFFVLINAKPNLGKRKEHAIRLLEIYQYVRVLVSNLSHVLRKSPQLT